MANLKPLQLAAQRRHDALLVPQAAFTPVLKPLQQAAQKHQVVAMPQAQKTGLPALAYALHTGGGSSPSPVASQPATYAPLSAPTQPAFAQMPQPTVNTQAVAQAVSNQAQAQGSVLAPTWFGAGTIAQAQQEAMASQGVIPSSQPIYGATTTYGAPSAWGWGTWVLIALGAYALGSRR